LISNIIKNGFTSTSSQTEADTAATVMNTKVTYENDIARKQKAATMAREAEMNRLNTQSTIQLSQAQKEEAAASAAAKAANEVQTNSEAEQLMVKAGLITAEEMETGATVQASLADIQLAINSKAVTLEEAKQIAITLGLDAAQLKAAGSATLLSKALNFIKAHPIIVGITAIIAVVTIARKAYDTWGNSAEKTTKAVKDLMSEYEHAINTANANANRVEELAEDYEKLSEGVNALGENVSLTNEEYDKYNSIVNEIAEMFPTMVKGYTDEGNAILKLKGNVDTLRNAYTEAQEEAYNLLIATGQDGNGNDILKDANNVINEKYVDDYTQGNKSVLMHIDEMQDILLDDNYKEILMKKTGLNTSFDPSDDDAEFRKWFTYLTGISTDGRAYIENISKEQVEEILKQLKIQKQTLNAEVDSVVDNVETLANAYLMNNEDYSKLDDEQVKNVASILVNNLNTDIVSEFGTNRENVGKYVNNIIEDLNNDKVKTAINKLFEPNLDDMPVNEASNIITQYIEEIVKATGRTEVELLELFGLEDYVKFSNNYNEVLRNAANQAQGYNYNDAYAKMEEFAFKYSINTQDELVLFNDFLEQTHYDIEKAFKLYQDHLVANYETEYERIENIWNNDFKEETREELLDLAKSGELTEKTLKSTEDYKKLLSQTGLTAEQVKDKILDLLSATEKLAMADTSTESLTSAYEEFLGKGFVTASTLTSMPETFKELDGFNLFESIVGDPTSGTDGTDAIQKAFNDILTEWYIANEVMKGITEDTKETYIANMEDMYIANAEEVANSVLENNDLLKSAEDEYLRILNFDGKTYEEYVTEKGKIDEEYYKYIGTSNALLYSKLGEAYQDDLENYYIALNNKNKLEKAYDKVQENRIKNNSLKTMALGVAFTQSNSAKNENDIMDLIESEYQKALEEWEQAKKILDDDLNLITTNFDFNFDKLNADSSSLQIFDWIETKIKRIQDAISSLGRTISATYKSWSTRNNAIAQETNKLLEEQNYQNQAAQKYLNKANAVGLDPTTASLVRDGAIQIDEITDETKKKQISQYQEWYEKHLEAKERAEEINSEIVDNYIESFDLVASEYDAKIGAIENRTSMLDALISNQEAKGHIVSQLFYKELQDEEYEKKLKLEAELLDLQEKLSDAMNAKGKDRVLEYSETWYEMTGAIDDVRESIIAANTQLIEYDKNIRQLDWDAFDMQQDHISKLTEETEFLMGLMEDEKLFDEDTGITEHGKATMGLHAVNYNTYLAQAEDYAKELKEINKDLAKDPYNTELIERREELLGLQRDMISAAQDEIQAIKDLQSEAYDNLLERLQEVIDKRKEALNAEKD